MQVNKIPGIAESVRDAGLNPITQTTDTETISLNAGIPCIYKYNT